MVTYLRIFPALKALIKKPADDDFPTFTSLMAKIIKDYLTAGKLEKTTSS